MGLLAKPVGENLHGLADFRGCLTGLGVNDMHRQRRELKIAKNDLQATISNFGGGLVRQNLR